jgi:hypothetical protein
MLRERNCCLAWEAHHAASLRAIPGNSALRELPG